MITCQEDIRVNKSEIKYIGSKKYNYECRDVFANKINIYESLIMKLR